jgi:predicted DNA-binding protein
MSKTKTAPKYPLIAFRVSADLGKQILNASKEEKVSKSALIKSAIEAYLKKRS